MKWTGAILLLSALSLAQSVKTQKPAPADDFSGMYSFLTPGEFVQINVEDGRLTGFISRYSDNEKAIFIDHFFEKAEVHVRDIRFSTRRVHGVWFDFKGTVSRGPGRTPNVEGYYQIKGTLTQYSSDANQSVTAKEREVTFTSFPQDTDEGLTAKPSRTRR
jgi:hypothetical protein